MVSLWSFCIYHGIYQGMVDTGSMLSIRRTDRADAGLPLRALPFSRTGTHSWPTCRTAGRCRVPSLASIGETLAFARSGCCSPVCARERLGTDAACLSGVQRLESDLPATSSFPSTGGCSPLSLQFICWPCRTLRWRVRCSGRMARLSRLWPRAARRWPEPSGALPVCPASSPCHPARPAGPAGMCACALARTGQS